MVVKVVATPCLQWSQPSVPPTHSPSSTTTTAAAILSPKKRTSNDIVFASRSNWLGTMSSNLYRTRSFEFNHPKPHRPPPHAIRRAVSASFDSSSDEEFSRKIQELASRFHHQDDDEGRTEPKWMEEIQQEPPDWTATSIEMKANSVDLPLSLRMIKRKKKQWQEEFIEAGESAYCSVKRAFSSMVFIIRELHSYTLHMRELLFYEDLKGILARVQGEMHASFVWLFQQVFSHTPTLMVYVMILLANFTVHSMANSTAIASVPPPIATMEEREITSTTATSGKFDSSAIKSFSISSSTGKTTSVGGGGGGGKTKPVASGTDGEGNIHRSIMPDGVSPFSTREESVSGQEEVGVWNSILDEASRVQAQLRDEALDHETVRRFVSPVTANIEADTDYEDYFRTELLYQTGLAQEPNNVLLLANYAQFLYLVAHDYDRAEEYFKRAVEVEPKDAEAHNKYATFLWQVRNDLWAAEETFLEAINADPSNSFYAANYAHFLWNTGGEDTCFPLDSPDNNHDDDQTLDA